MQYRRDHLRDTRDAPDGRAVNDGGRTCVTFVLAFCIIALHERGRFLSKAMNSGRSGGPISTHPFYCLHTHGFVRAAVATPRLRVADPAFNVARTIEMAREADKRGASLVLFPELGISAPTRSTIFCSRRRCSPLSTRRLPISSKRRAPSIRSLSSARRCVVGGVCIIAPSRSCAAAILAVTPKIYLPNYREFYERRHFASGAYIAGEEISSREPVRSFRLRRVA